jgi:hypothetical protein
MFHLLIDKSCTMESSTLFCHVILFSSVRFQSNYPQAAQQLSVSRTLVFSVRAAAATIPSPRAPLPLPPSHA